MRGVFNTHIEITSLSIAKTILYAAVPSGIVAEILSVSITNGSVSVAEQLRSGIFLVTTVGSPATTTSPTIHTQKSEQGSAATGLTFIGDLTTEPTTYNASPIDQQSWNNQSGYYFDPLPEMRPIIPPSTSFGIRLLAAPNTAFKASCEIIYREIG